MSETAAAFVRRYRRVHGRTARLIPLIPPDRLEWRAAPGAMSPGDLLRHLAGTERWMWAENACGRPAAFPGHGESLASGIDATREYFERLHAETVAMIGQLTADQFSQIVRLPGDVTRPLPVWLDAMLEHHAHHRGQLYLLLRLLGVPTPPLYGLTSEELAAQARSSSE